MTIINPNSISGITSITAQGSNIDFFRSDGALAGLELGGVNFYSTSGVSTFSSIHVGNDIRINSGIVTATTFSGALSGNVTGNVTGNLNSSGVNTVTTLNTTNIKHPSFGSDTFVLDSSGNINIDSGGVYYDATNNRFGIGTTTPGATLQVSPSSGSANFQVSRGSKGLQINQDSDSADPNINVIGTTALKFLRDGSDSMMIDSSGRLLVGTTSSINNECIFQSAGDSTRDWAIKYTGTAGGAETGIRWLDKNNAVNAQISNNLQNDGVGTAAAHLVFKTATGGTLTERMRISDGGGFKASNTGSYVLSSTDSNHEFSRNAANSAALHVYHTASSGTPYGIYFQYSQQNPNNATSYVFTSLDNNGSNIYTIYSNGTVSARSDAKFKKNIETARDGYLEDLAQLRVVKYNWYNHDDDAPKELGFIAQEVEQVFPGLVSTIPDKDDQGNETGEVSKSIKTSVFTPMLVKALQEAMERIEQLEAKVAALESA